MDDDDAPIPDPRRRGFLSGLGRAGALAAAGGVGYVVRGGVARPVGRLWNPDEMESRGAAGVLPEHEERLGIRRIIWSVPTTKQSVAMTFDDGPDPEFTPRVLEALGERGLTATFNVMGWNADRHRDLLAEVVAAGHEIGNHTWTHRNLAVTDDDDVRSEMQHGTEIIEELTGTTLRFFRPPRGNVTGLVTRIAAELGQDILSWSLSGSVFDPSTSEKVRGWVVPNVQPGHIISFHDGIGRGTFDRSSGSAKDLIQRRTSEIDVLPRMLDELLERGFAFLTVGDLVDEGEVSDRRSGP